MRGNASMLFGRGSGGVINQISKTPLRFNQSRVSTTVGTNEYGRVTADLNRRLGPDMGLRINLLKSASENTRNAVQFRSEGVAPTLEWRISPTDELMVSLYHLKTDNTLDYGVPYYRNRPLDVPADRFYGTTGDFEENKTDMGTIRYRHRFSAFSEVTTVVRAASYERALWGLLPASTTPVWPPPAAS